MRYTCHKSISELTKQFLNEIMKLNSLVFNIYTHKYNCQYKY